MTNNDKMIRMALLYVCTHSQTYYLQTTVLKLYYAWTNRVVRNGTLFLHISVWKIIHIFSERWGQGNPEKMITVETQQAKIATERWNRPLPGTCCRKNVYEANPPQIRLPVLKIDKFHIFLCHAYHFFQHGCCMIRLLDKKISRTFISSM